MRVVVVFIFILASAAKERGEFCLAPNNKTAACIPFRECPSIINITRAECGYDTEQLVCCPDKGAFINGIGLPNNTFCGWDSSSKLVYGRTTPLKELPWLAALEYQQKSNGKKAGIRCDGSVISSRFVLTAAHCIRTANYDLIRVWLGDYRLATDPDCENSYCADPVKKIQVQNQIPHPRYDPVSHQHDIGLLRLDSDVEFTDFVRPLCLSSAALSNQGLSNGLTVSGWNLMEEAPLDLKLKYVLLPLSNEACLKELQPSASIATNQMCATTGDSAELCWGSSGAPIMRLNGNNYSEGARWYIEGVTSWTAGCKNVIFTEVFVYRNWIIDTINAD